MALKPLELEVSGRPKIKENEVEVYVQDKVEISGDIIPGPVLFRLTTHRILLQSPPGWAKQIPLQNVMDLTCRSNGWIHKSIHFTIYVQEEGGGSTTTNTTHQIEFGCIDGERDTLVAKIQQMLKARQWETVNILSTQTTKKKTEFTTTKAGITGLIRNQEDKNKEIGSSMLQAFSDLKALMANAEEMVSLAVRLHADHNPSEENEVRDLMLDMGLVVSPVTKEMAGNLFHSELARQLTDFLQVHLVKNNGIMTLTDVYCLYNRARGTELISPDDLYQASLLFEKLDLPLQLRKFEESGVLAVQSKSYDDSSMVEMIKGMVKDKLFPLTVVEFAQEKNISIPLAKYFLQKAEQEGILCRDDSFEGVIFYDNIFLNAVLR